MPQFFFLPESSLNQAYGSLEVFPISNFLGSTAPWPMSTGWMGGCKDDPCLKLVPLPSFPRYGIITKTIAMVMLLEFWSKTLSSAQDPDFQIFQMQKPRRFPWNFSREICVFSSSTLLKNLAVTESPIPWAHLSCLPLKFLGEPPESKQWMFLKYRGQKKGEKKHTAKINISIPLFFSCHLVWQKQRWDADLMMILLDPWILNQGEFIWNHHVLPMVGTCFGSSCGCGDCLHGWGWSEWERGKWKLVLFWVGLFGSDYCRTCQPTTGSRIHT